MDRFAFVAPTCSADGYGVSAEELTLAAIREHGADIAFVEYQAWRDVRYSDPQLLELSSTTFVQEAHDRDTTVVYFLPYALGHFQGQRTTICQTMWESDRMPDQWAFLANRQSNGMIVPSAHCAQVFGERVEVPIEVVPYGTDTQLYTYFDRGRARLENPCVFLMAGMLHYRKGVEFALRAFREEFTNGEPVQLWLKSRLTHLDPGSERAMLLDPRVRTITVDMTREELRDMYHAADCFLAPSRGEGSGLTPRDAMATGLPTIVTDWGGLAELADERYAWPVPVADLEEVPYDNTSYDLNVAGPGPLGRMARPSVEHLRASMREVYQDRTAAYARGQAAARWMRERWTWGHCAGRWLEAIESLSAVREAA